MPMPVVVPGKWNYYKRYRDGSLNYSEWQSGAPDSIVPGKDGKPDTIYKRIFIEPKPPKHDIPDKPANGNKIY